MPVSTTDGLRLANARLRATLSLWQIQPNYAAVVRPQILVELLGELCNATEWLRGVPADWSRDAELEREIVEYRTNVEQLSQILPAMHESLLAQKARLETARTHLAKAAAWIDADKQTL
jgi:hypothetical protein